jgi:hypothetical protein
MDLSLKYNVKHILILGAGASVEYGLPVWRELCNLIKNEIRSDTNSERKYKKEIIGWLDKVGKQKTYKTIDECISYESILSKVGPEIENELFSIIKDVFNKRYVENNNGWIRVLNDRIINSKNKSFDDSLAFVNFNYDNVLENNFLFFSHLSSKETKFNKRIRLNELHPVKIIALYPHGKFSENKGIESHIIVKKDTIKSHDPNYLDAVSCYEGNDQNTIKNSFDYPFEIYLMGLGDGLEMNLNKIEFNSPISTIHVTIKDLQRKNIVIKFLSEKYLKSDIKIYSSCEELVKKCFND